MGILKNLLIDLLWPSEFNRWLRASKGDFPNSTSRAVLTPWLNVGTVKFDSQFIQAEDYEMYGISDFNIKIKPGLFRVEARGAAFDQHRRVAMIRIYPEGAVTTPGEILYEICVDSWGVLIGDRTELYRDMSEKQKEIFHGRHLSNYVRGVQIIQLPGPHRNIPFVSAFSGLGDGKYQLRALNENGQLAGFEIEFIPDGFLLEVP